MSMLKETRKRVGLTQAELAASVGVTQGAIAHYENGRREPGLDECRRILKALNRKGAKTTLDKLFPPKPADTQAA
ncbi:helix-turn-helix transcriptional regulator [Pseudomonas oryzihabitans]|uniref:helix-turn-helix transcriptional regulator n=1 Tax=Pseudomonas oryzihabitans TaxID=47885 RepID=UPI00241EB8E3|nr:helix-turn-helix transcriptional regulator [Pseudomonas oryzihabitans]